MIKVAGYCRVSTDREDQVNSFASQQVFFRDYIERQPDWQLHDIYADEGITGTSTKKRTQFNRMVRDAYEGKFSLIITKEVSRFSRNILDTIAYTRELKSIGVGVLFLTDRINTLEPEAEMLLSFLASLAQEESRRTSMRVVWGQTRQMERGIVFGHSMLGYDVSDGKITVNPKGAELVKLIFHKYAIEQVGTTVLARFLTEKGYCTYRGCTNWKSNTVIKILNNEKYVGDLIQKKSYTPDFLTHEKRRNTGQVPLICIENHHEPIISREVWNLTQERLHKNNKHKNDMTGHSNRYVFSGKIKCGECGASFVGRYKYQKNGTGIRRWRCAAATSGGVAACDVGKLLRDDEAVGMLKTAVSSLRLDINAIVRNVTDLTLSAIKAEEKDINNVSRLRYEINCIQRKKEALMDCYFNQEITKEDMQSMKQRYTKQQESLQARLILSEQTKQHWEVMRAALQAELTSILSGEAESEIFNKTILDSLTIYKDRHMELRLNYLSHIFIFSE